MDIKKPGGLPLPQPPTPLASDKSGSAPRLPNVTPGIQANWQSGQILQALVLKATPEHLLLNIQGIRASVARPPAIRLQSGDRLQLEVVKNSKPAQLKLIDVQTTVTTTLNRALRASLPQQQALPPLLANIEYLSRDPAAVSQLDKAVRTAAQQIYYQLPTPESLRKPEALKQALALSGPFLENHLHHAQQAGAQQAGGNIQQDLRTRLLRLSTQLQHYIARQSAQHLPARQASLPPQTVARQTGAEPVTTNPHAVPPPVSARNPGVHAPVNASLAQTNPGRAAEQLLQQTEGALARLHIHQLQHLKGEEVGRPGWAMELPVRSEQGINLFDIRIHPEDQSPVFWHDEQQAPDQQQLAQRWSVRMAFDLEGLGPVQAIISLQQEQISVQFHAEQKQTTTLFNEYLAMLGSRLRQSGLEVARLDCHQGQPDPLPETIDEPILDEQA